MAESDAELPSPAPLLAALAPSAPLGSGQTGPADPSTSVLPAPTPEPADGPDPVARAADLEPTEARASHQIRPEPDAATALPPLAPDRAGRFEDGPNAKEADTTGRSAAQDLLPPGETGSLGPLWDELADRAAHYATRARGAGTRRTYKSASTHFSQWCRSLDREPLSGDPNLVAMYVVRRADDGLTVSSIRVALAAIRTAHLLAGVALDLSQPRSRMTLEGVVRSRGVRPTRQAPPAVPDVLEKMLAALPSPESPLGIRNRAMLLLGFGAALRRSELVGVRIGDVARCFGPEGRDALPLFCGMSKAGRLSSVAHSDKAVARLVKSAAASAGLDAEKYSGHSLRAGLATAAGDQGAGLADLVRQTRHKSTEVALGYLRPADLWRNNVTDRLLRPLTRE